MVSRAVEKCGLHPERVRWRHLVSGTQMNSQSGRQHHSFYIPVLILQAAEE